MHVAASRSTASVGSTMRGSGRSSTRTSPGADITATRITVSSQSDGQDLPAPTVTSPGAGCDSTKPHTHPGRKSLREGVPIGHPKLVSDVLALRLRFGVHDITVPEPLARLLTELLDNGRSHCGVGSPATSPWLFPGHLPGRPITASRLGERLRLLGVRALPGRRATLLQFAAGVPAAVLAELLHLTPGTATRWTRDAAGDWSRYAADLARKNDYQHRRIAIPPGPQAEAIRRDRNTADYQYQSRRTGPGSHAGPRSLPNQSDPGHLLSRDARTRR